MVGDNGRMGEGAAWRVGNKVNDYIIYTILLFRVKQFIYYQIKTILLYMINQFTVSFIKVNSNSEST